MATFAGLLHHLVDHVPGLSETNRQEYHDLIDEEDAKEQAETGQPAAGTAPAPQE